MVAHKACSHTPCQKARSRLPARNARTLVHSSNTTHVFSTCIRPGLVPDSLSEYSGIAFAHAHDHDCLGLAHHAALASV